MFYGDNGYGWELPSEVIGSEPPDWDAVVKAYLLCCPVYEGDINYWIVSLLNLNKLEQNDVYKYYSEAQYEITVSAIAPETKPDPTDWNSLHCIVPNDIMLQFSGTTETQALNIIQLLTKLTIAGDLHPFTEESVNWKEMIAHSGAEYCVNGYEIDRDLFHEAS